jgi:hypothetical protein
MSFSQELRGALGAHFADLGREVPRFYVVSSPAELMVHRGDAGLEDRFGLQWLVDEWATLPETARRTRLLEAARDLAPFLEAPIGAWSFHTWWSKQTRELGRGRLEAARPTLKRTIAPELDLEVELDAFTLHWLSRLLEVPDASNCSAQEVFRAVEQFLVPRVRLSALGPGTFEVVGSGNDVVLMRPEAFALSGIQGPLVALRLGGDRLAFTGAEDSIGLQRIIVDALASLGRLRADGVPDARFFLRSQGRWQPWLPPRAAPRAREAFLMLRRQALLGQYQLQERCLSHRLRTVAFSRLERGPHFSGRPDCPTVCDWREGDPAWLPIADAYCLIPQQGAQRVVAGRAALELFARGCLALPVWNADRPVRPARLQVLRFPTQAERAALPHFEPDPLEWWEDRLPPGFPSAEPHV